MIKQKLRILALQQLTSHPRSGYGLIREIKSATGWKPSYGSIYPLLEQFKKEALVTCKEKGKKKVYTLTQKGIEATEEFNNHHSETIAKMREDHRLIAHMCGMKDDTLTEMFFSALERGEQPFHQIMKASLAMKKELARIYQEGNIEKSKRAVNAILEEATEKLRRV